MKFLILIGGVMIVMLVILGIAYLAENLTLRSANARKRK